MKLARWLPFVLWLSQSACGAPPMSPTPVTSPTPPAETGASPRAFAYVPDAGGLFGFAIGEDGALTPIPGSPFAGTGAIVMDRTRGVLYAGNYVYRMNRRTGTLTTIEGSPFPAGVFRVNGIDPLGRLLYTAAGGAPNCAGSDPIPPPPGNLYAYRINPSTGALSQIDGSPFHLAIDPLAIFPDPLGRYVDVLSRGCDGGGWEAPAELSVFGVEADGDHLSPRSGPFLVTRPYEVRDGYADLGPPAALDATGDFLYVAYEYVNLYDRGGIATYAIGPDGVPERRGSVGTDDRVWTGLGLAPSGRFALASYFDRPPNGGILTLPVDLRTGVLSAGPQISTAIEPGRLMLTESGDRAFHVEIFDGSRPWSLYGYAIDASTGILTPLPGSPLLLPDDRYGYYRLFIEPSGRFVYAAIGTQGTGGRSGRIFGYSVAPDTGALSPLPGSPFSAPSLTLNSLLSLDVVVVPAAP